MKSKKTLVFYRCTDFFGYCSKDRKPKLGFPEDVDLCDRKPKGCQYYQTEPQKMKEE
jgi:hypothetical protein